MKLRVVLIFGLLSFLSTKTICQLSEHQDYELNQLNLFVKYINESNNVLSLLYSEVTYDTKNIRDNFESSIFHLPQLTLLDRQTCLFMDAVINANSRHYDSPPFTVLMDQLGVLKKAEGSLNEYVVEVTDNLKDFDDLTIEMLVPYYREIQHSQANILETLELVEFESDVCELCQTSITLYNDLKTLLTVENIDQSEEKAAELIEAIDDLNIEAWDSFSYPKRLLEEAIAKLKEAALAVNTNELSIEKKNRILVNYFYQPEGLPQLFNNAFEKFKNQNKETKYINIAAIPILVE